jgi:hypothetical protein
MTMNPKCRKQVDNPAIDKLRGISCERFRMLIHFIVYSLDNIGSDDFLPYECEKQDPGSAEDFFLPRNIVIITGWIPTLESQLGTILE